jgi:tripartite-type tricarboxylate transporter receptor subunit TctC
MLLCAAGMASAQAASAYPDRPVKLIDPYAPGGSTTVVSQVLAQKFEKVAGQVMIVEHRPGAAGNIGSNTVAHATPDGYTLLMGTSSLAINPSLYESMPFDPVKDLAPIVTLIGTPNVLAVNAKLPIHSVKELIDYARAHPGKLNYGSSGIGATNHMGMELFKSMAKVDLVHVPFKGGAEAMNGLLGGQVDVMFNPASTVMPHTRDGKVRVLGVGSAQPVAGLNLPTVSESGLPGFESVVWFGLFAPAGTPPAIVQKLNADINLILQDKQVQDVLHNAGLNAVGGTAASLGTLLAHDSAQWAAVAKASKIQPILKKE